MIAYQFFIFCRYCKLWIYIICYILFVNVNAKYAGNILTELHGGNKELIGASQWPLIQKGVEGREQGHFQWSIHNVCLYVCLLFFT